MKSMVKMMFDRERYEATFLIDVGDAQILIDALPTDWRVRPDGTEVISAEFSRMPAAMLYENNHFVDDMKSTEVQGLIKWILAKAKGGD